MQYFFQIIELHVPRVLVKYAQAIRGNLVGLPSWSDEAFSPPEARGQGESSDEDSESEDPGRSVTDPEALMSPPDEVGETGAAMAELGVSDSILETEVAKNVGCRPARDRGCGDG